MAEPGQTSSGLMRQMVLDEPGAALRMVEAPIPRPGPGQVLLEVAACAVCDIDPQILAGAMPGTQYPLVPGHEIIGHVLELGQGVEFQPGQRLGVAWLGDSCGTCQYCRQQQEHLCDQQRFTGLHLQGGYASHVLANAQHCYRMDKVRVQPGPVVEHDGGGWSEEAAMTPLLCEGALAYRSYQSCREATRIGLYGFGTAAQLICQLAKARGQEVYAMTRAGGEALLELASALGADWTGTVDQAPPRILDAAVLLQPTVELVPHALSAVRRDGTLVFLGMHASRVPSFPYDLFMHEHRIHSISRSARSDMLQFLALCSEQPLKIRVTTYPLAEANRALAARGHDHPGQAVLVMKDA